MLMGRSKKLLIHAGLHKTATTTLQRAFCMNRDNLSKHGICYPKGSESKHDAHHYLACKMSNPDFNGNHYFRQEREIFCTNSQRSIKLDLMSLGSGAPNESVLISSEIFSTFNHSELVKLHKFNAKNAIEFHFYFRSGLDFLYSIWSAKVRWGYTESFLKYLARSLLFLPGTPVVSIYQFVQNLLEIFGTNSVRPRSYDDAILNEGGIITDFFDNVLGGIKSAPEDSKIFLNKNSAPEVIELARVLKLFADRSGMSDRRFIFSYLTKKLNQESGKGIFSNMLASIFESLDSIFEIDETEAKKTKSGLRSKLKSSMNLMESWAPFKGSAIRKIDTDKLLELALHHKIMDKFWEEIRGGIENGD